MSDPAAPPDDRKARALALVAQYRGKFPPDGRSDDDLLRAPYGGYELADLVGDETASIPERMRRLALAARGGTFDPIARGVAAALKQIQDGVAALRAQQAALHAHAADTIATPADLQTLAATKKTLDAAKPG